jgi:L-asparaginase
MHIKVFTTGGSLDKGYSTLESDFVVLGPQVSGILETARVTVPFEVEPLLRKDSLEMTDADRTLIRQRVEGDSAQHILITHGTDTMALTGRALEGIPGKVIILTGAMQPAAFRDSDAPFNVGFAVAAVQTLPPGVYLAMNGRIFEPRRVRKDTGLDRFEEDG